jgi:hypothetical protein
MLVNDSSKASPANLQHLKRNLLAVISTLLCFLGMLPTTAPAASYTTDFPKAEPPNSEGGRWITAGTPGVHWHETMCGIAVPASGPSASLRMVEWLAIDSLFQVKQEGLCWL